VALSCESFAFPFKGRIREIAIYGNGQVGYEKSGSRNQERLVLLEIFRLWPLVNLDAAFDAGVNKDLRNSSYAVKSKGAVDAWGDLSFRTYSRSP